MSALEVVTTMRYTNRRLRYVALQEMLSQLETLATLFSCVIHDVDHPGFTNSYLINTGQ